MNDAGDVVEIPGLPRGPDGPVFNAPWEAQAFAMALAGCSLAPDYKPPEMSLPAGFKEIAVKDPGPWQPAKPSDALPRGDWWRDYHDATLAGLEAGAVTRRKFLASLLVRM